MSASTQNALDIEQYTTFTSDIIDVAARAVVPAGGTQFVFETATGDERTVLEADFATVFSRNVQCVRIDSTTDCTSVWVYR